MEERSFRLKQRVTVDETECGVIIAKTYTDPPTYDVSCDDNHYRYVEAKRLQHVQ